MVDPSIAWLRLTSNTKTSALVFPSPGVPESETDTRSIESTVGWIVSMTICPSVSVSPAVKPLPMFPATSAKLAATSSARETVPSPEPVTVTS